MSREAALLVMVGFAVVVLALMWLGWRRRARRDGGLQAPLGEVSGTELMRAEGYYVATTRHDAPLDRLVVRHLAFRGKAGVVVTDQGVALSVPGEPPIFFPRASLRGVGHATWTIDRVVERDGLVLLAWQIDDDTTADSYLRLGRAESSRFCELVEELLTPLSTGNA